MCSWLFKIYLLFVASTNYFCSHKYHCAPNCVGFFSFIQWYIYSRLRVFTINAIFPLFSNLRFTLLLLACFVSLSLCSSHRIRISYKCRAYNSKCLFLFSQFVRVFFFLFKYFPCSHFFIWCRCKHFIYFNRTFNFGCD